MLPTMNAKFGRSNCICTCFHRSNDPLAPTTAQVSPAPSSGAAMTLRRLLVWMHNPMQRLKALGTIISKGAGVRGGQLLSAVFDFTLSGDTSVQVLAKHILNALMPAFLEMLSAWVYRGVLLDSTGYGKICDMGFARFCLAKTNTLVGTPDYMAPEVIRKIGHGSEAWDRLPLP